MKDILITSCSRTAVGSLGKTLKNVKSDEMGAAVISNEINKLLKDYKYIDKILLEGSVKAEKISKKKVSEIKTKIGF